MNELKIKNQNKILDLINKLEQCNNLEKQLNEDIKYAFKINDKLNKLQSEAEDLFFIICKNINIKF